jgi:DNA-binding LacI/PurR family transcriptional regulator
MFTESIPHNSPRKRQLLDDLSAELKRIAHLRGPGHKMPTVLQLQEQFGVSIGTLDRALGWLEQEHVITRLHGKGIFVSEGLIRNICFVCDPSFFRGAGASPFWSILLEWAFEKSVQRKLGFSLHFSTSFGESDLSLHSGIIEEIISGNVHGILAVGLSKETLDWIGANSVPVVGFACPAQWTVSLDMPQMVRDAVSSLATAGCKSIGLWKPVAPFRRGDFNTIAEDYIFNAFIDALANLHLDFDDRLSPLTSEWLVNDTGLATLTHQEQGYYLAERIFGSEYGVRPDGIVISDDLMAQGVLTALRNMGVGIPGDVKVASHCNVGSMALLGYDQVVTRIEFNPEELAESMFTLLDLMLSGEHSALKNIIVVPKIRQPSVR